MIKILQINTTANSCSHGRIAEGIGKMVSAKDGISYIAYGRTAYNSDSNLIKIGNELDLAIHLAKTRLFDRHGFASLSATRSFLRKLDEIDPDIIHLHNLHGYYLNIKILFEYLKKVEKPIVWTFHDCWPFTGHCSHFMYLNCSKWKTQCYDCPLTHGYTKSWFIDNSRKNYSDKRLLFSNLKNLVLVPPSEWLAGHLRESFLSNYEIKVINNGVDLDKFKPVNDAITREKYNLKGKYILGVASTWTKKKGLDDFWNLRKILDPRIEIVLVGLTRMQAKSLPFGVKGVTRTENVNELASLYSGAEVFVNPTYVDNFPSVNIEAQACGTPVVTYDTGGSPESLSPNTGRVVSKGDISGLREATMQLLSQDKQILSDSCRERAKTFYNLGNKFHEYISLYERLLKDHESKRLSN